MKRRHLKLLFCSLAILTAFTLTSVDTLACTCDLPSLKLTRKQHVTQARVKARAVFSGTVLRIDKSGYGVKATLKVQTWWKGTLSKEVVVFTGRGGGDCGYRFEVGESYLVYAYGERVTSLATNICQRTATLNAGQDDLKILGKPKRSAGH